MRIFVLAGKLALTIFFMEDRKISWVAGAIIIGLVWWALGLNGQLSKVKEENLALQQRVSDYSSSLQEANDNIEQANGYIEDAQGYAWATYQEMGDAIDSLQTVDTVSGPF
ncbi:MAG: hypothetical protein HY420_01960 [Candidatus Kerfeldbacteria bacterium]|nr:hypothetical protein [Candidatus Kerfeldbacteria bacterium]